MRLSIGDIVADPTLMALTFRQALDPVDREAPVFGPTYPPDEVRQLVKLFCGTDRLRHLRGTQMPDGHADWTL